MSKELISKLEECLMILKGEAGSHAKFKMDDDEAEQSYEAPVDEGNSEKKKMFVASMKKKLGA